MAGQIHRIKHEKNFVVLDKSVLQDSRLSWKAKGLHCYLMQLPDDWDINMRDLQGRSTDGRDSTSGAMNELLRTGYVKRVRVLDENAKTFVGWDYHVFEQPSDNQSENGFSEIGFPEDGLPEIGKTAPTKNYNNQELSKPNSLSVESERAPRKGGKKTPKPAQPAQRDAGGPDYTFADFWNDYGHKVGSKPKTEKAFAKLTAADRDAIRATLEIYKRETVTKDAQRGARDFRPMRQHPLTYLNGRMWETYTDRAGEADAPTPYDADYQKYLDWVKENYPLLLHAAGHFSKTQFVEYKTKTPTEVIGSQSVLAFLKQAHNQGSEAFPVFQTLVQNRLKIRQV